MSKDMNTVWGSIIDRSKPTIDYYVSPNTSMILKNAGFPFSNYDKTKYYDKLLNYGTRVITTKDTQKEEQIFGTIILSKGPEATNNFMRSYHRMCETAAIDDVVKWLYQDKDIVIEVVNNSMIDGELTYKVYKDLGDRYLAINVKGYSKNYIRYDVPIGDAFEAWDLAIRAACLYLLDQK